MTKTEIYENVLIWVVALVIIGLMCLGVWTLRELPLLPPIVLIFTSLISFLVIKNHEYVNNEIKVETIVSGLFAVSVVCAFFIYLSNGKQEANMDKVFFKGKIHKEEVFKEGDGETKDHYETAYIFIPEDDGNKTKIEILSWILIIVGLGIPILNYYLLVKAIKVVNSKKHPID